jgi:hypothetical protein
MNTKMNSPDTEVCLGPRDIPQLREKGDFAMNLAGDQCAPSQCSVNACEPPCKVEPCDDDIWKTPFLEFCQMGK